ncbi:MAG: hypothetical protein FJW20_24195 [Acidimicrobiia bacterium]|nr:hypothetical protein [Acidimicrobiia bacterium]
MRAAFALLAVWCFGTAWAESGGSRFAPTYSAASIVNSASNQPGSLAPNTIATLYGSELAFITRAIRPDDIRNNLLPTVLAGSGVQVMINRTLLANIYFVSPTQVNLLIPASIDPGPGFLQLILDGRAGPEIPIRMEAAAPALYLQAPNLAVATRADGSLIEPARPARPEEWVVLYCTGLGETSPRVRYLEVPRSPATLLHMDQFRVLVNGLALPRENIAYAGLTPGFAGLYQVNLRLPAGTSPHPEIRLAASGATSPAGVLLPFLPE